MIRISYNEAGFRSRMQALLAKAENPTAMLLAVGRELSNQLRAHFARKDREQPNKLSSRREHFWLQVRSSVNAPVQTGDNAVSVNVSDPRIAQKVFGGKIVAKEAGALTIPVSEKAYGRTASTFERETGLKLILIRQGGKKSGSGKAILAAKVGGGLEVEYLLTKSVDQEPDPTALPDEGFLKEKLIERGQAVLERQLAAEGGE